jgi:transcriptional regulator with XRE-family HTH domain
VEPREFGKNIQRLRRSAGLTQEQLADRADIAPRVIQRIESGMANPKIGTLQDIAQALGCSIRDFYDGAAIESVSPSGIFTPEAQKMWAAWSAAADEPWRHAVALFFLSGDQKHLAEVDSEFRRRLLSGMSFYGMNPSKKARAPKK